MLLHAVHTPAMLLHAVHTPAMLLHAVHTPAMLLHAVHTLQFHAELARGSDSMSEKQVPSTSLP